MITSDDLTLQSELYELTHTLLARKYPLNIINTQITKALAYSQKLILRTPDNISTSSALPLVTKYTPAGINLQHNIHQSWHLIEDNPRTRSIFPTKPVTAFTKPQTIGNTLVRSHTPNNHHHSTSFLIFVRTLLDIHVYYLWVSSFVFK